MGFRETKSLSGGGGKECRLERVSTLKNDLNILGGTTAWVGGKFTVQESFALWKDITVN